MYEVVEMQIDKLPFLVMLTELLAIMLQEVCLESVLVKEVIPFIDNRLEPATTDGFGFLGHYLVEILLSFVSRIGINIDAKRFMTDNFHSLFVPIPRIII